MDYGSEKIGIYNKKFIPDTQMRVNFLGFLTAGMDSLYASIFPGQGCLGAAIPLGASGNDSFDITLPFNVVMVMDGGTRKLAADSGDVGVFEQVPFENESAIPYYIGLKFLEIPDQMQLNVRNGRVEADTWRQSVGESGDPDSVADLGSDQLKIVLDTILEAGVNHSGRICRIKLKEPVSLAAAYEDLVVQWDGSNNYVVSTYMGQITPSVDETDYIGYTEGPTVKRNTDLSTDPDYTFLGTVTGSGAGTTPTVFDITGQNIYLSTPGVGINDLWTIYQDMYTTPHFDGDGLPNLDHALQTIMDVEHYPHDSTDYGRHSDIHPDTVDFNIQSGLQLNIQAFDAADKANHKVEIKDDLAAVRAWIDGDGNAQFQDLYVQGTEYIMESTIIEGDLTVEGDLTAGDDNTVDRFYGHVLRADFDKDVHVGQDLYVAGNSYLGDDAADRVTVTGGIDGGLSLYNGLFRIHDLFGSGEKLEMSAGVTNAVFSHTTNGANDVYYQFQKNPGIGRLIITGDILRMTGGLEIADGGEGLQFGTFSPDIFTMSRTSATIFDFQGDNAGNVTWRFGNAGAGEADLQVSRRITASDRITTSDNIYMDGAGGGTLSALSGALSFDDFNLVGPSPLPLSGPAAVDNTYNGSATTLIGMLNETLSSGSLDFNYDAGGAGLGREIIVDAGAVAFNREAHPVTVNLTTGVFNNINIVSGDDWSDYYDSFPNSPSRQILIHITGSTLGNNGWYTSTPSGNSTMQIATGFPGGAESGISATWYDTAIYGTKGGALSLESYLDSPTNGINGWRIFQSGSARFGIDASQFTDPLVAGAPGLEWDFYGDQPMMTFHDTPSGNWARVVFTGNQFELYDDTPQLALYYNFTNMHLNGGGVTKCQGFLDPVYSQDLATKNSVDNQSVLPPTVYTKHGEIVNSELGDDAVVIDPNGRYPFQYRVTVPNGSPTNAYHVAVIMLQADSSFFANFRPYAYGYWSAGGSKYLRWILKNGTSAGSTVLYDSGNVYCPYTSNTWIFGSWGSIPSHSNIGQLYRLEIYGAAAFEVASNFVLRGVAHLIQYTNYAPTV